MPVAITLRYADDNSVARVVQSGQYPVTESYFVKDCDEITFSLRPAQLKACLLYTSIKGQGTFAFPKKTTHNHLDTDTHFVTENDDTWGKWTLVDDSHTYTKATTEYYAKGRGGKFLTLEGASDEAQLISTDEKSWLQVLPQEMCIRDSLLVALGGAFGAFSRYGLSLLWSTHITTAPSWSGTLLENVARSAILVHLIQMC